MPVRDPLLCKQTESTCGNTPQHRALIVGKRSLKGHVSLACLQGSVTLGFDLIPQALIANYGHNVTIFLNHNQKMPKILQLLGKWSLPLVCM